MYKITRIYASGIEHWKQLKREGKRDEALDYIRGRTDVLGEFYSYLDAREFWRALGLNPGANYHVTRWAIYRMGVARTD